MRTPIKYFVSYARKHYAQTETFLSDLQDHLGMDPDYAYSSWKDNMIPVGENWHEQIQSAIKDCDFGLLILSPAFFSSGYILQQELARFLKKGKIIKKFAPVGLVSFKLSADLKGLNQFQIFLKQQSDGSKRFYDKMHTRSLKNEFAQEFSAHLNHKLRIGNQ